MTNPVRCGIFITKRRWENELRKLRAEEEEIKEKIMPLWIF